MSVRWPESWKLSAPGLDILMGSGVGVATDHISSRFAVFADSANDGELLLRVSDLNSVSKYAAASHYLSSLAPVKNVYAVEVNQYQVDFHIELSGEESDLKRIIALGKVLVPDTRVEPVLTKPATDNQTDSTQPIFNGEPVEKSPGSRLPNIMRYRLNG